MRLTVVKSEPVDMPADRDLLARVAAGEAVAFQSLLRRHLPRMVSAARRLLGSDSDAEDVAQEAALRLWRNAGRLEIGEAGVGGWLYRVTKNLALDRIRGRRKEDVDALERLTVPPAQELGLVEQDLGARVDQALRTLPERQRMALVLCHFEEMSMAEAGGVMAISSEAVESLLARGRRALREALQDDWRALLPSHDDGRQD